ncbi:hypothetical protein NPIL_607081 [Nephila pilipes]|uniref:Uncharacterized protein n=1 Tax=Nephila pilipes TaxID=299642 RepID=A0A8X6TZB7_NEPPI|nr:hypothetical protein NPIL_607081 [Nephila pilipes]
MEEICCQIFEFIEKSPFRPESNSTSLRVIFNANALTSSKSTGADFPLASSALLQDVYMDDVLSGADSLTGLHYIPTRGTLTSSELSHALLCIVKIVQRTSFVTEIQCFEKNSIVIDLAKSSRALGKWGEEAIANNRTNKTYTIFSIPHGQPVAVVEKLISQTIEMPALSFINQQIFSPQSELFIQISPRRKKFPIHPMQQDGYKIEA